VTGVILLISAVFLVIYGTALVASPHCRTTSGAAETVLGTIILAAGLVLILWGMPAAYVALGMKP